MAAKINKLLRGVMLLGMIGICSCTKYNYIDSGLANGVHDCSMWEYFKTDRYNWDSTMIMIDHAGLKPLFEGTGEYKQITFFGITNNTIVRYMLDYNRKLDEDKLAGEEVDDSEYWHRVTDIPASVCVPLLKSLIVTKRLMLDDVPDGNRKLIDGKSKKEYEEIDGIVVPTMLSELFLWVVRGDYGGVQHAGYASLNMAKRLSTAENWIVGSTDIQTNNGVVQAMGYEFLLRDF
ncbi:hypothetical protein [Butyricimonas hominis]|uniref:Uncharacterized protein n=1 Tax=Butyricimonas hominis TaxID=2763032 RepID=A0ABR7CWY2_9BACT|nr:hypothetical protein [Butyricimonas hominis]MBC5620152.1 hypothetical protein [Butyricimonas hominis]